MVILRSCLIWPIIYFIIPLYEYGCVYAWTTLRNIATLPSAPYVRYLAKKVKETSTLIDKPKCEKPKTVSTPQKVCVKHHQHQFNVVNHWLNHHWDKFCVKILVWRHVKSHWFRSWSQLTIQCAFASLSGPAIDLQKTPILQNKKSSFRMKLILILAGM